eukprot:6184176-Pleurochrysis_carterae.AAC.5
MLQAQVRAVKRATCDWFTTLAISAKTPPPTRRGGGRGHRALRDRVGDCALRGLLQPGRWLL